MTRVVYFNQAPEKHQKQTLVDVSPVPVPALISVPVPVSVPAKRVYGISDKT